jgi:hypothetical protein
MEMGKFLREKTSRQARATRQPSPGRPRAFCRPGSAIRERRPDMIEILEQSTERCLAVHFSGKVTGQDYQLFLKSLEERLKSGQEVNLAVKLANFEFYGDFDAAKKDIKFGLGEYKHVRRMALFGDQEWIGWFVRIFGAFTPTEEKRFSAAETETAIQWASE